MSLTSLTLSLPSGKVYPDMSKRTRRRTNAAKQWLGLLGLAAVMAVLILSSSRLVPAIWPKLRYLRSRPKPSLEALRSSLDNFNDWQTWFQAAGDTAPEQWRLIVPAKQPLVKVNLEVHRLSDRHRVVVESAVEDQRRGLLLMMLTDGVRRARLVVRKGDTEDGSIQSHPMLALVAYEIAGDWKQQSKRILDCSPVMTIAGSIRASDLGREFLAYLPLEPKGYPKQDPGPNTLLVDDRPAALRSKLSRVLSSNPKTAGFCIHYGSRAVEDEALMAEVAKFCAEKDLPLLEPLPTVASLATSSCRQSGAVYFTPDVFIAKTAKIDQSKALLAKAIKTAEARGRALVLLPASETALRAAKELFYKKSSCQLVPLSRLRQR